MRFWERQRQARRSTRWLLLVFGLCVLAVVASVHLGLMLAWWLGTLAFGGWDYPTGFATVNIGVTLLLVLGGCWIELDQLRHGGRQLAQRVGAREADPAARWPSSSCAISSMKCALRRTGLCPRLRCWRGPRPSTPLRRAGMRKMPSSP